MRVLSPKLLPPFFVLFIFSFSCDVFCRNNPLLDSLLKVVQSTKEDTIKITALNELCHEYGDSGNYDIALKYCNEALQLSIKLNFKKGVSAAYSNTGDIHTGQGNYSDAMPYYQKSLAIEEKLGDKKGMAERYNDIGRIHTFLGNYRDAFMFFRKSLAIMEKLGDKKGMAVSYNNIGGVHSHRGNYPDAISHFLKSLKIDEELNDKKEMAADYNNIGCIYFLLDNYADAMAHFQKSLAIKEELGDKQDLSIAYNNIGLIYSKQGSDPLAHSVQRDSLLHKALEYFFKSLKIRKELGDKNGIASCYINIGSTYITLSDTTKNLSCDSINALYNLAMLYHKKALTISEEIGDKLSATYAFSGIGKVLVKRAAILPDELISERRELLEQAVIYYSRACVISDTLHAIEELKIALLGLSESYSGLAAAYKSSSVKKSEFLMKAMETYKRYKQWNDTIFNQESSKQISKLQTKYEIEKKEKEIELLQKDNLLKESALNRQKIIILAIAGGISLLLIIVILLYLGFRKKQKVNNLLSERNHLITKQKQHIVDSITYAKRIQQSFLMREDNAKAMLPFDSFILFMPRDIVSGDFYFFSHIQDKFIIAACDCTGHGVPGAMMSMLGNSFLNEIVNEKKITTPSEILKELHLGISKTLHQEQEAQAQDGMDIALCTIDLKNHAVTYAGAMNHMYVARNNAIEIIKADIKSIGGRQIRTDIGTDRFFTDKQILYEPPFSFYLFTDGINDQFKKNNGMSERFGSTRFKQLLSDINTFNIELQKQILSETIDKWMAYQKQTDDILVIGVKIC